jgi:hypothetical protein
MSAADGNKFKDVIDLFFESQSSLAFSALNQQTKETAWHRRVDHRGDAWINLINNRVWRRSLRPSVQAPFNALAGMAGGARLLKVAAASRRTLPAARVSSSAHTSCAPTGINRRTRAKARVSAAKLRNPGFTDSFSPF